MTWKANPEALRNVGRANASLNGRKIIADLGAEGLPVVAAVASDKMADIIRQFKDGSGLIVYMRSRDLVDFLALELGADYSVTDFPAHITVGEVIAQMDEQDARQSVFEPVTTENHRQLALA